MAKHADVHVLRASHTDAKATLDVLRASWLVTYPNKKHNITVEDIEARFHARMTPAALAKRAMEIREMPSEKTLLTANIRHSDRSRTVVGVCSVTRGDEFNELRTLYVHPEHVGCGIGYALFEASKQFLRCDRDTYVQVAVYNKKAMRFYLRQGFVYCEIPNEKSGIDLQGGKRIPTMKLVLWAKAASK